VRRLIILALALFLLVPPGGAFAHGLGQSQDLPLPLWLYFFGAATVVLVSFVQIGLFVGQGHALRRYPRFDLLRVGPLRALLTARPLLTGLRRCRSRFLRWSYSAAFWADRARTPTSPPRSSGSPGGWASASLRR
jgi:hypothetical protein